MITKHSFSLSLFLTRVDWFASQMVQYESKGQRRPVDENASFAVSLHVAHALAQRRKESSLGLQRCRSRKKPAKKEKTVLSVHFVWMSCAVTM
jgi:hypothetical protein